MTQCASFLPMDPSLVTLDLAEAACGANPACGGISDLYCRSFHPLYPNDHYALCNGTATVPDSLYGTCTFEKPMWSIVRGAACTAMSPTTCVTDGVVTHGNRERCTISALTALYATATPRRTGTT